MQTLLPLADFVESARVLDMRRLGKQRVEAKQLINTLQHGGGWSRHPAAIMWMDHVPALMRYHDVCVEEWVRRGYNNTMILYRPRVYTLPPWFGDFEFHSRHRSQLLAKAPDHYRQFGWDDAPGLDYLWPSWLQ